MSITELLYLFLNFIRRFWWILAIILLPYSCRFYGAMEVTRPLKKEAIQIVDISINWWHLPKEQGGGGMEPLSKIGLMSLSEHISSQLVNAEFPTIQKELEEFIKDPKRERGFDFGTPNGTYTIEVIPDKPNHITLYGHKLTPRFYNTSVRFEISSIDLSIKSQIPKLKFKQHWIISLW